MSRELYVNFFKSPAELTKFVYKNKIKHIVSITRNGDDLELWYRCDLKKLLGRENE